MGVLKLNNFVNSIFNFLSLGGTSLLYPVELILPLIDVLADVVVLGFIAS